MATDLDAEVRTLAEEIRLLKSLAGRGDPLLGMLMGSEDRMAAGWAMLAAILANTSPTDAFLRLALEAGIGQAELRVVRDRQSIAPSTVYQFVYVPKANRVLRVLGGLNVIALRHVQGLTVSIRIDNALQPVIAADLSVADLPLEPYVFKPIRSSLVIEVANTSAETVGIAVDTHLVDLEPVLHDDELRLYLDRLWTALRRLGQ